MTTSHTTAGGLEAPCECCGLQEATIRYGVADQDGYILTHWVCQDCCPWQLQRETSQVGWFRWCTNFDSDDGDGEQPVSCRAEYYVRGDLAWADIVCPHRDSVDAWVHGPFTVVYPPGSWRVYRRVQGFGSYGGKAIEEVRLG